MEPRFGHDFSQVRVHADDRAAESARAVNALAYTVGRDVVFGRGQYMPGTMEGMRLMAHELTHVIQQGVRNSSLQEKLVVGQPDDPYEREAETQAANVIEGRGVDTVSIQGQPGIARLQRKIDPVKELTGTGCKPPTTSPAGPLFARVHFGFDKDQVSAKEEAEIDMFVTGSGGGSGLSNVRVDGYASTVGDERYNLHLSCRRAKAVRKELAKKLHMLSEASIATFAHGETSEWSDKKLKKGPEENQIAIISANPGASTKPVPAVPVTLKKCGPDSTQWLVNQMNTHRNNPVIRDLREDQWKKYIPFYNLVHYHSLLKDFGELVGPGRPWDFKRKQQRWRVQASQSCPTQDCDQTVTLCGRCFNYDVPGNIHYGWIGSYAGIRTGSSTIARLQRRSAG